MKRITLLCILLFSMPVFANTQCEKLAMLTNENSIMYGTKYFHTVQGAKGYRTYFHSAPSHDCRIKNLFLIPGDSVIAYQEFKNDGISWIYVMYVDKDGKDTSGWMKDSDFKITSRLSLISSDE